MDEAGALAAADEADAVARRGEGGPLLGVPFLVKDNLWIQGLRSTQGSRLFADFVAPADAIAVERMRQAGAVPLGITACSEFACKGTTDTPLHGVTRNPWDLARTPGGSSGGAAAAVAAGLAPVAITTDGGGSTRRPAAHTGLVGMKPSQGRVPHAGGFAEPVFGNGVVGQLARRVADVALVLSVLSGADARDWYAVPLPPPDPAAVDLGGLRVAFSPRLGLDVAVDEEVAQAVARTVERLRAAGLAIETADPAWPEGAGERGLAPLQEAGLAALYGERFRRDPGLFDPEIGRQIERGLGLDGVAVGRALLFREAAAQALAAFFGRYDLLLSPTVPCVPWPADRLGPERIGGRPADARGHAVFTPLMNHAGVPACSVPCGLVQGLPVGLQVVGPRFADDRVLAAAALAERVSGGPPAPPVPFGKLTRPQPGGSCAIHAASGAASPTDTFGAGRR